MWETVPSIEEYFDKLPENRRETIQTLRRLILNYLPLGYEESVQYGMISYIIPFDTYKPNGKKQPLGYISIASNPKHVSLYFWYMLYGDQEINDWFIGKYKETGKKLDMGKSCIRFNDIDEIPLDLIKEFVAKISIEKFIETYERSMEK